MSEAFWKSRKGDRYCSVRDCNNEATKRVDLAVVGRRGFGAFGKGREWEECVRCFETAVCDDCYERMMKPPIIRSLYEYLIGFVKRSWKEMEERDLVDGT